MEQTIGAGAAKREGPGEGMLAGGSGVEGADRRSDPVTEEVLRRLRSVEGHVRGVGRMVEEDAYCMDVLNQVLAVQRALKKVSGLLLDRHLHHCATRAIRGEDREERERVIGEILEAFHASNRS